LGENQGKVTSETRRKCIMEIGRWVGEKTDRKHNEKFSNVYKPKGCSVYNGDGMHAILCSWPWNDGWPMS
jgi:hypothetical protein